MHGRTPCLQSDCGTNAWCCAWSLGWALRFDCARNGNLQAPLRPLGDSHYLIMIITPHMRSVCMQSTILYKLNTQSENGGMLLLFETKVAQQIDEQCADISSARISAVRGADDWH